MTAVASAGLWAVPPSATFQGLWNLSLAYPLPHTIEIPLVMSTPTLWKGDGCYGEGSENHISDGSVGAGFHRGGAHSDKLKIMLKLAGGSWGLKTRTLRGRSVKDFLQYMVNLVSA